MTSPPAAPPTPPRGRWHMLVYSTVAGSGDRLGLIRRQLLVDAVLLLAAIGFGGFILIPTIGAHTRAGLVTDLVLGAVACGSLAWRRRCPAAVGGLTIAASAVSASAAGAAMVALLTAAIRVRPKVVAALTAAQLAATFCFPLLYPQAAGYSYQTQIIMGGLMNLAVVGWGLMIRAQRGYLRAVLERAHDLEVGQALLAATIRDQERRRIAREMHDTLAHRLSLLSVHAGALAFRCDLSPEQTRSMATIVRQASHDALGDLHKVIGILRDGQAGEANALQPQVTLDDLATLVQESRLSGTEIHLDQRIDQADLATSPNAAATAYRIVQEGLTNARKHAPASPVHITVEAGAPGEIVVTVSTPLGGRPTAASIPGTGTGLIGLRERVSLLGGSFRSGRAGNRFVVNARLPWEI
ncbi:sensor histidine kinase [Micromonospora sp. NPDC047670]|uniref:sensor histidine kinase n=1 Tax=Micromonospora sp. NPDC047670 TaxID=3364252 RepID=UPI003717FD51